MTMDIIDYNKAKQECWESSPYYMEREAFNYVFKRAYQLGKAHAENEAHEPIKMPILQIPEPQVVPSELLKVAAMAMQGLLANSTWMSNLAKGFSKGYDNDKDASQALIHEVVSSSVEIADALLTELNKENE